VAVKLIQTSKRSHRRLHNRLHGTRRSRPNMPVDRDFDPRKLLKPHEPTLELLHVAPRVAGSNPVAHPNFFNDLTLLRSLLSCTLVAQRFNLFHSF
jgi:hypothetical protein